LLDFTSLSKSESKKERTYERTSLTIPKLQENKSTVHQKVYSYPKKTWGEGSNENFGEQAYCRK
jgi:hypothetical protein